MSRENRMRLIDEIEEIRGSKLLVYYTGDRVNQEIRIASDIHPISYEHLLNIGDTEKIDLLLYTPGGITMAGFGLVNLIREFCENFNVIIPFRALSCGTLISLGADEIIMTKLGQLSPIDPSVEHPLGPSIEVSPQQKVGVPVNVEDAVSFLNLAKKEAKLTDENNLCRVFSQLADGVHPLALGAVERSREQIGFLAKQLLKYHINDDEKKVNKIVNVLTRERFSHDYLIGRREASETLELNIKKSELNRQLDKAILDLHKEYSDILELHTPFHPELYLNNGPRNTVGLIRGVFESKNKTHVFRSSIIIERVDMPMPGSPVPAVGYQQRSLGDSWVLDNAI